ncbi:MAG: hypothetical protein CMM61_07460, partial [Rhodospirillaceae bacterium]|nr:hypothetical protein [Rhodospirillaceae bacterium]
MVKKLYRRIVPLSLRRAVWLLKSRIIFTCQLSGGLVIGALALCLAPLRRYRFGAISPERLGHMV